MYQYMLYRKRNSSNWSPKSLHYFSDMWICLSLCRADLRSGFETRSSVTVWWMFQEGRSWNLRLRRKVGQAAHTRKNIHLLYISILSLFPHYGDHKRPRGCVIQNETRLEASVFFNPYELTATFWLCWALRFAPNNGEVLDRKLGARTVKSSSTVWAAELWNTDTFGG
jgi:hypothetical protein